MEFAHLYKQCIHFRVSEIAANKFLSIWQYFPDTLYHLMSPTGREYAKHLNLIHAFTTKVRIWLVFTAAFAF